METSFLAGQHEGDPRRRVLIVNPEPGTGHIHPIELRDTRHAPAPETESDLHALTAAVSAHLTRITDPINAVGPATPAPWLPTHYEHSSPPFVGRVRQLWQIHSALHQRKAQLTDSRAGRVAVVYGLAGIGKSRLAHQYATQFHAAYPGGICWLTAHPDDPLDSLARQRAFIAGALRGAASSVELAVHDIAQLDTAPLLWVLDNVPAGLPIDCLRGFLCPHPAATTLVTTTDRRYARLGSTGGIEPLPRTDARALLPIDWTESDPALCDRLIELADGHPGALTALAHNRSVTEALDELRTHPAMLAELAHRITEPLHTGSPDTDPHIAHDLLRTVAALEPAHTHITHLTGVVQQLHQLSARSARRETNAALSLLEALSLVHATGDHTLIMSPLVAQLVRTFDPYPARHTEIRSLALSTLRTDLPAHRRHRRPPRPTALQQIAWALQVELAHRVAVLANPDYSLRDTLAPLYSLVALIRTPPTSAGPEPEHRPVHEIGITLLSRHLRPVLTRWHPRLLDHEYTRPTGTAPIDHERTWPHAHQLRHELTALHTALSETLTQLGTITHSRPSAD